MIFNTFPLMSGRIVPPAFMVLSPPLLNVVQNAVTVQWLHRLIGSILLIAALVLFFRVRASGADRRSRRLNATLSSLIAGQYLLGVLTLVYFVPVALGVAHQATAMVIAGLWVVWTHHVHHLTAT
jgi:heme a synthase